MRLVGTHTRRELYITLGVWAVLLTGSIVGLLMLRAHAVDIINRIHYVNVTRGSKAAALYAEAEKNARQVLTKFQTLNAKSPQLVPVPADDKHLQQSISLYNEALKTDPQPQFSPTRTIPYEILAQVYEASGNIVGQLLTHARALLTIGDTATALTYIENASKAAPETGEPGVLLARIRLMENNLPAARQAIDEAFTSGTETPEARSLHAEILKQEGKPEQATAELQKAVDADPKNLDYRQNLAQNLADTGDKQTAAKTMQTGLADGGWLDPAYLHTYSIYLLDLNDLEEAVRVLEQADQLAPYSGDVQFSLARAYHKAGKTRQAASALRRATEVNPELQKQILD